ncbi:hypothetical protein M3699_16555, partial [Peribacillus simplex]|uniref:hypothetical protein n=1 Tax=Peribacillus simplex TaxID=1478 RepID=UPI0020420C46
GESRGGSPTARGKRVPGVEINVQIVQAIKIDKLDFHRVCLQSVISMISYLDGHTVSPGKYGLTILRKFKYQNLISHLHY